MLANLTRPSILHIRNDRFEQLVADAQDSSVTKEAALSKALGGNFMFKLKRLFGVNSYKAADHLYDLLKAQEKFRNPNIPEHEIRAARDHSLNLLKKLEELAEPEFRRKFTPTLTRGTHTEYPYFYEIDLQEIGGAAEHPEIDPDFPDYGAPVNNSQITVPVFSSENAQTVWQRYSQRDLDESAMRNLDKIFEKDDSSGAQATKPIEEIIEENFNKFTALPKEIGNLAKIEVTESAGNSENIRIKQSIDGTVIASGSYSREKLSDALAKNSNLISYVKDKKSEDSQKTFLELQLKNPRDLDTVLTLLTNAKKLPHGAGRVDTLNSITEYLVGGSNGYDIDTAKCTFSVSTKEDTDT